MTGKTVTRADLAEAVYREIGLSRNESAKLVESVLALIGDGLTRGETVKISSFGSFSVRNKGQRIGRNPKTGQEVPIMPRKVLVFRASHVLKDWINGIEPDDQNGMGELGAGREDGNMGAASSVTIAAGVSPIPAREPATKFGSSGLSLPEDPPNRGGSSGS